MTLEQDLLLFYQMSVQILRVNFSKNLLKNQNLDIFILMIQKMKTSFWMTRLFGEINENLAIQLRILLFD